MWSAMEQFTRQQQQRAARNVSWRIPRCAAKVRSIQLFAAALCGLQRRVYIFLMSGMESCFGFVFFVSNVMWHVRVVFIRVFIYKLIVISTFWPSPIHRFCLHDSAPTIWLNLVFPLIQQIGILNKACSCFKKFEKLYTSVTGNSNLDDYVK